MSRRANCSTTYIAHTTHNLDRICRDCSTTNITDGCARLVDSDSTIYSGESTATSHANSHPRSAKGKHTRILCRHACNCISI